MSGAEGGGYEKSLEGGKHVSYIQGKEKSGLLYWRTWGPYSWASFVQVLTL